MTAPKATAKYRLSYSAEQLEVLLLGLVALEEHCPEHARSSTFYRLKENLTAYVAGGKSPAYQVTGAKPGPKPLPKTSINIADLIGSPLPVPQAETISSIEELKAFYANYLACKKPFVELGQLTLTHSEQEAVTGWETYCRENDLDPVTTAQES